MPIYTGREEAYAIVQQADFGTAEADDTAATEMNTAHFNLPDDVRVIGDDTAHKSRIKTYANHIADISLSMPKFSIGHKVNTNDQDLFAAAFFQKAVESNPSGSIYKKVLTPHADQPEFESDEGFFYTVFKRDPVAAQSWKVKSALAESLKFSVKQDGFLEFTCGMVAKGAPISSTPTGTWTPTPTTGTPNPYLAFEAYKIFSIDFGAGAVQPRLMDAEVDLKRSVEKVGADGNGTFATFALIEWDGTFDIHIVRDANVETARTACRAGTGIHFRLGWGGATPGNAIGDFDIQWYGKLTSVEIDDGKILGAHLKGSILAPDDVTDAITLTMANGTNRGWSA